MAIAFSANIAAWGSFSAGPRSSASFNPASGETILVVVADGTGTGRTLAYGGTVNTPTAKIAIDDTTHGNEIGMAEVLSATTGSQTISVNGGPTGDQVAGHAIRYSGVSSTGSYTSKLNTAGLTTGIVGNSVVVPSGSVLVAFVIETNGTIVVFTGQTNGGVAPTDRIQSDDGVMFYSFSEWVGTGGSITPTWNASAGADAVVIQVVLTGSAGSPSLVHAASPAPQRNRRSSCRYM